jgi:hypothetical protein
LLAIAFICCKYNQPQLSKGVKLLKMSVKVLKIGLALAVLYYISKPFRTHGFAIELIQRDLLSLPVWTGLVLLLLAILNYGIEAIKWKKAVSPLVNLDFIYAYKSVLSGQASSAVVPWKTGEFFGRVAFLKAEDRVAGSYLSVYASMTQFGITLLAGIPAFFYYFPLWLAQTNATTRVEEKIGLLLLGSIVLLLFLFVFRNSLWRIMRKLSGPRNKYYMKSNWRIQSSLTIQLLGLSFVRYLSFLLPYALILFILNDTLDLLPFVGVMSLVFMIQSAFPGFIFTDLPLKGTLHLSLFSVLLPALNGVGTAVLCVFLFNQALPALLGLIIWVFDKKSYLKE